MPRHTQPREVAEAKGATRHDPQRYRNKPPKAAFELGQAPPHLSDQAKAVWFEVAGYAAAGVLTCADRIAMELLCELLADFREAPREFPAARIGHLIGCLGRLGMTPADRQKLSAPEPEKVNAFDSF